MNRPIAWLVVVLSFFAVLSSARAQDLAPGAVVPRLTEPAVRDPRASHRAGRIALEASTGLVAGFVGGVPGVLGIAGESVSASFGGDVSDGLIALTAVGMFGGIVISDAAAIALSGNALDGRGSFWPTLLGTTLGFAAGFVPLYVAALTGDALGALGLATGGLALGLATSVVGGVLAFELTGDSSEHHGPTEQGSHWAVGVSPVRHGAVGEVTFVI